MRKNYHFCGNIAQAVGTMTERLKIYLNSTLPSTTDKLKMIHIYKDTHKQPTIKVCIKPCAHLILFIQGFGSKRSIINGKTNIPGAAIMTLEVTTWLIPLIGAMLDLPTMFPFSSATSIPKMFIMNQRRLQNDNH